MYTCCRDGHKREFTGSNKTGKSRKHRQSRKLENYCIARMIATENRSEGRVEVKYISTHTNHEVTVTECRHLPLPNPMREDICKQFAAGISLERIMDSMYTHAYARAHTHTHTYTHTHTHTHTHNTHIHTHTQYIRSYKFVCP